MKQLHEPKLALLGRFCAVSKLQLNIQKQIDVLLSLQITWAQGLRLFNKCTHVMSSLVCSSDVLALTECLIPELWEGHKRNFVCKFKHNLLISH